MDPTDRVVNTSVLTRDSRFEADGLWFGADGLLFGADRLLFWVPA
jgi:hypothetical protein